MRWTTANRFSLLLTRFTVPEEVFGPVSVAGLREDVYRRVCTGKLPEAQVAFLDEVFKAPSAILNTLLKILNERTVEIRDGTSDRHTSAVKSGGK
jgi:MoxR-like ATPase